MLNGAQAQTLAALGDTRLEHLLARMTLSEKIGQLTLVSADTGTARPGNLRQEIQQGTAAS